MLRFITSLSINRLNKADDGCFVGIEIGNPFCPNFIQAFGRFYPKLWASFLTGMSNFAHRYGQKCSSLWAEKLIVMAKNAQR